MIKLPIYDGTVPASYAPGISVQEQLALIRSKINELVEAWNSAGLTTHDVVMYTEQEKTALEKAQARQNIGAAAAQALTYLENVVTNNYTVLDGKINNTTEAIPTNITDLAGTLPISRGGTGSTTAAAARTALGITTSNIGAVPFFDLGGFSTDAWFAQMQNINTNNAVAFIKLAINYTASTGNIHGLGGGSWFLLALRQSEEYSRIFAMHAWQTNPAVTIKQINREAGAWATDFTPVFP